MPKHKTKRFRLSGTKEPDLLVADLKPPPTKNRDPAFREFDGVAPQSSIPACTYGKKQKVADKCKAKLFFAGAETASELTAKLGSDYGIGAYLRLCGPKTNDELVIVPAKSVETAMRASKTACECLDAPGETPSTCVTKASALSGVRRRRRK